MKQEFKELLSTFSDVVKIIHTNSYHKHENLSIYPGQPQLLFLILRHEGISQKELAAKNHVTPATITGMLRKLESQGYIYRKSDSEDKRIMRVFITEEGKNLANHCNTHLDSMVITLFKDFTKDEILTLTALMNKVKDNVSE